MTKSMDATPKQKVLITRLCMRLKIVDPLEERPMSKGEAGVQIRILLMQAKKQTEYERACSERSNRDSGMESR